MKFRILPLQKGSRTPVIVAIRLEIFIELIEFTARLNQPYATAEEYDSLRFMKQVDNSDAFVKIWNHLYAHLRQDPDLLKGYPVEPGKSFRFKVRFTENRTAPVQVVLRLRNNAELAELVGRLEEPFLKTAKHDSFEEMTKDDNPDVFEPLWRKLKEHLLKPEGVEDIGTRGNETFWE